MSNRKNISTFINAYRKQQEIEAFEKEVSEAGGIEISKARQLVIDSNLNQKQSAEMYKMIDSWKGKGFVIDDIPMEFGTYQTGAKEQGKYAIRKSVFQQMTDEQRERYLNHSHPALYDDKHLEPLKNVNDHIEKRLMDLEVNKDNYKAFYPPKKETA